MTVVSSAITATGPGRWTVRAMDTVFSITLPDIDHDRSGRLAADVAADFEDVEARLSVFRPDSEISRWRDGLIADDELSASTREVLAACDHLAAATGGLFSAGRDEGYDPTGYVKGWALSRAAACLDRAGVSSYCVNGGGDIIARGVGPHGVPWRVGVVHPARPGEFATIITAIPGDQRPLAVATSGTSERGRHIVNPIDGWRPDRSTLTVVGHDIALVDALATAALASGRAGTTAQTRLLDGFGLQAFGFDEDRRPWWTPGMPRYALLPRTVTASGMAAHP